MNTIILLIVSGLGLGLSVYFAVRSVTPCIEGNRTLDQAITTLRQVRTDTEVSGEPVSELSAVSPAFENPLLGLLWSEFKDTLHEQYLKGPVADDPLATRPVVLRQTVPARDFFSYSALVEAPLKTEVFKHLPGLLTGLGIIGTFSGVISGLTGFDPSSGSGTVELISSVREAFIVSAAAIGAAILITFLEKRMVNGRVQRIAQLCDLIDALFRTGSEHEYLRDIKDATGTSAAQLEQLKLITSSIDQVNATMQEQTTGVLERVDAALAEPLSELMPRLVAQIEGEFGKQIVALHEATAAATIGINDALERMEATVRKLEAVANSTREAGTALASHLDATAVIVAGMKDATEISAATLEGARSTAEQLAGAGDSLAESLASTEQALANARREAAVTDQLIDGLAASANALDTFTGDLGSNLVSAQQKFSQAAGQALETQSKEFHDDLSAAVGLLHGAIADLTETFETITDSIEVLRRDVDALQPAALNDDAPEGQREGG